MKISTILLAAFVGIVVGTTASLASSVSTVTYPPTQVQPSPVGMVSPRDEVPKPPVVTTLSETIITASAPRPTKSPKSRPLPAKVWTCGAPHEMSQGPLGKTVKNCDWR